MSANNNGGAAFPEAGLAGLPNGEFIHGRPGMSLRDYFAAAVPDEAFSKEGDYNDSFKAQLVGRPCPSLTMDGAIAVAQFEADFRAKWRFMRADAMLKARQS